MSSGHEIALGFAWLTSTLTANATLMSQAVGGVWRAYAPPGTVPPWIILAHQSGTDVIQMNAFRLMSRQLFQVKVVGPASGMATLAQAAEQFDTLIGSPPAFGSVVIGGNMVGYVLSSYRQSPLEVDELVNGELWTNLGGLYELQIEQTS